MHGCALEAPRTATGNLRLPLVTAKTFHGQESILRISHFTCGIIITKIISLSQLKADFNL